MKALQTQFDGKRLSNAVATPTCSSCCCCCCCLATSIASSTLLAQRIAKEGEQHKVMNRHLLTILAALFVPVVGILVYFGFWTINLVAHRCTLITGDIGSSPYTVCTTPGSAWVIPLLIVVPLLVLTYLYARVRVQKPFIRAIMVTALIVAAFIGEATGGAMLILTGVGGIVYLILVPVVVGWITVWYHKHIGKEVGYDNVATQHPWEPHDQEPPQQDTPHFGAQ